MDGEGESKDTVAYNSQVVQSVYSGRLVVVEEEEGKGIPGVRTWRACFEECWGLRIPSHIVNSKDMRLLGITCTLVVANRWSFLAGPISLQTGYTGGSGQGGQLVKFYCNPDFDSKSYLEYTKQSKTGHVGGEGHVPQAVWDKNINCFSAVVYSPGSHLRTVSVWLFLDGGAIPIAAVLTRPHIPQDPVQPWSAFSLTVDDLMYYREESHQ